MGLGSDFICDYAEVDRGKNKKLAGQLAGTGSNLLSNAVASIQSSTGAGRDILAYEQWRRDRDREAGAGMGKTIYDIFYPAQGGGGLAEILGDIFKSKTGSR